MKTGIILCFFSFSFYAETCKTEARCKTSRIHGLKSADCYNKDIEDFPQCLPSNVEIVDLSRNRIRTLGKNDLTRYSDLQILYLQYNIIVSIDEETFVGQNELHTLDLSRNGLFKIPPSIFQLPSLKSLYLGHNLNPNLVETVNQARPVTKSLIHLDISYTTTDEPNELPELGVLPAFTRYNISRNKLISVTTKHFAGLCSLKSIDTRNVTIKYQNPCDCWTLNRWLNSRKIQFENLECSISEKDCLEDVPPEDLKLYQDCKKEIDDLLQKSTLIKIFVPIIVVLGLIIIAITYYVYKKKKRQRKINDRMRAEAESLYENEMLKK